MLPKEQSTTQCSGFGGFWFFLPVPAAIPGHRQSWEGTAGAESVPSWAIPIVRAIFDCRMGTPTWATFFWGESFWCHQLGEGNSSFVPSLAWGQGSPCSLHRVSLVCLQINCLLEGFVAASVVWWDSFAEIDCAL